MSRRRRGVVLACALLAACAAGAWARAAGESPLAGYFGNTLIWKDDTSGVIGRLWLDADGRYRVFFNRGPQPRAATIDGPFQLEGAEGTWALRGEASSASLCLYPAAPHVPLASAVLDEPYSAGRCYPLPDHAPGQAWTARSADGRGFRYWLVAGR